MSDHYFSEVPASRSMATKLHVDFGDLAFDLFTDQGVFSARELDRGTRLLLESDLHPTSEGDLIDVGCGYGPITVALAMRHPERHVWGVDVNSRAMELTRSNCQRLELSNVTVCSPDDVPREVLFGSIYSNPPIRVGKQALHEILSRWLARLRVDGRAFLVVHKHLGSDSLASWLESSGHEVQRLRSRSGFRILSVGRADDQIDRDSG